MNEIAQLSTPAETMMANAIRALTMDAVEAAKSGHPGMPMGMADVAAVLFKRFVKLDPSAPGWADRDRFVLSAGHGSMLLYAVHHLLGYADMPMGQLRAFRQFGSRTAGHPEYGHAAGIEVTTGPLGQGIATATGMALAERMLNARFGDDLVDHFTYVMAGDGCLMEGISHEAIDMAGHLGLGRLIVLWDDNGITIDGGTELSTSTDQLARFAASGWHVQRVDGHAAEEIAAAIEAARADARPSLIACRTVIGYGAPTKQGSHDVHGAPLGAPEIAAAREALGWTSAPFEIPEAVYAEWRAVAERGREAHAAWVARLAKSSLRDEFTAFHTAPDARALDAAIGAYKHSLIQSAPNVATRKSSEMALEVLNETLPNTVGGSADLTGSNNTRSKGMTSVRPGNFGGRYIHYGIREHGMAAAMNGIALHGGLRPYGGTFLAFADYARGAIRLSALMGVPVTYVLTHDSIGLGEDGPTHQPVEHLASLRAMPNLNVIRPADAVEAAEAWQIAATAEARPSALILSRQNLPMIRGRHIDENLTARGAYLLRDPVEGRDVTLIATGSEVQIAVAAARLLEARGLRAAVVSAPCFELFAEQGPAYRLRVRGSAPRVGIEAAIRQGWDLFLERNDAFVGMTGFGASAPAARLYEHFGITPDAVAEAAERAIANNRKQEELA
ncbi:transketolase [Sedimentimonas flavescens]|uniref:transketolase n=1 Tax=Sedimentimonas flavescens TaxID=2851012 RepID=UPI0021A263C3|nr:transketolase [Sedimentimonas flavescens]MCT2538845.1 transketolase [Sedimentimonas flavescens]